MTTDEFDRVVDGLPRYDEDDYCTQLEFPDLSPVTTTRAYTVRGIHDHAEAVKRLRARLERQIAGAQAVLALTDDQFTVTHHEVR